MRTRKIHYQETSGQPAVGGRHHLLLTAHCPKPTADCSLPTILFLGALLLNFLQLRAQTELPPSLPPGVDVKIVAQPQKATVGDPINIDLDITVPPGCQVRLPKISGQAGDYSVLDLFPGPDLPGASGPQKPAQPSPTQDRASWHHRARIVVALYKTGKFDFPPIQMTLRTSEGKEISFSSPPVSVEIQSVLAATDQALKDLKKQAEIQEPVRWILWLALALLIGGFGAIAWWVWQRRSRLSPPLPTLPRIDPLDAAEVELRDLLGRSFLESGFVKQFYVLLSDIVKRILEAGYGIHTVEKTTSEIMEGLRNGPASGPTAENPDRIESLLVQCDLVKFAKYVPSKAEHDVALEQAFQILAEVRKMKAPPAAQGPAQPAGVS